MYILVDTDVGVELDMSRNRKDMEDLIELLVAHHGESERDVLEIVEWEE